MKKYEYVEKDKRKSKLRHGVECYPCLLQIPLEVKEAARLQGETVTDFMFKLALKELKEIRKNETK
jgi:hypothetical protein